MGISPGRKVNIIARTGSARGIRCPLPDSVRAYDSVPRTPYAPLIPTMTAITELLAPHVRDLGGFKVRRVLPGMPRQTVGPFIFFDHMGPVQFAPGAGVDVRPHPHIGLATVTYLFEGALLHRDSLGNVQRITAGDVNWMTAGRGIVHSERSPSEDRATGARMHGLQTWVALPRVDEDAAPSFIHIESARLPVVERDDAKITVVAGHAFGSRAPTPVC